jgi:phosphoribosylformylglycinamidine cyclo-ligase
MGSHFNKKTKRKEIDIMSENKAQGTVGGAVEGDFYAKAGVNVKLGEKFSSYAGGICKDSWGNCHYLSVRDFRNGNFRGPVGYDLRNLPWDRMFTGGADGVGTKVTFHALGNMRNVAYDLMAMILDDIARSGCMPVAISNVLDVKTLGKKDEESPEYKAFISMFDGLAEVAKAYSIALLPGETAELGSCVGSEVVDMEGFPMFNWAGFAIGALLPNKIIDGSRIVPGNLIVALREKVLRSNGFSAVRKYLREKFGDEWWLRPECQELIREIARPSTIYASLLAEANGWYAHDFKARIDITGIAHITGGGILEKFGKSLIARTGHSAMLYGLYEPNQIMCDVVQASGMTDEDAYTTFNGGQGCLVMVPSLNEMMRLIAFARTRGFEAKKVGEVIDSGSDGQRLEIESQYSRKRFTYPL